MYGNRCRLILLIPSCIVQGFQPSLFWSYYSKPSVDRTTVGTGGYERDTPQVWAGDYQENDKGRDNILRLGALTKISHGPRRKRGAEPGTVLYNDDQIEDLRDFISLWPRKYSKASVEAVPKNVYQSYQDHYRKFQAVTDNPVQVFAKPYCRHVCHIGDPAIPCCASLAKVHSIGPYVQPSLLENWVTGAFEFAATNQILVMSGISTILLGILAIILFSWGYIGESMGLVELPRARFINPVSEFKDEERLVLDIVAGNWLATLEDHVMKTEELQGKKNFLCCVFSPQEGEEVLECFPHLTRIVHTQPSFTCKSSLKYDISLNLEALKPVEQNI